MPRCPTCAESYPSGARFCPADGSALTTDAKTAEPDPAAALCGQILDRRYRIDAPIGRGGMGAVYRAHHLLMDRDVAIKVLRPDLAADDLATRRFAREARSSSRLDDPHCVRVTDFGVSDEGLAYLVMELLDGRTVGDELYDDGALAPARVAHIARQTCAALAHAHGIGIVHRDLKPDNLMLLARDGDPDFVKVLDFGLAKLLEQDGGDGGVSTLTQAGVVFGTPEYMSPEQAQGKPLDARADVYSLGAVVYQMVTGAVPFDGASFMIILRHHVTTTPVAPAVRRPDLGIPPELDRVVMECLAKDPARRPLDARTLAERFAAIAAALPAAAARVPARVAASPTVDLPVLGAEAKAEQEAARPGSGPSAAPEPRSGLSGPAEAPPPNRPSSALTVELQRPRRWLWAAAALPVAAVAVALALRARGSATDGSNAISLPAVAARAAEAAPGEAEPAALLATEPPRSAEPTPAAAIAPDAAPAGAPSPAAAAARGEPSRRSAVLAQHLAGAEQARKAGNTLKQLAEADAALHIDPSNARAAQLLGEALLASGDRENGCRYLARARRLPEARARHAAECKGQ